MNCNVFAYLFLHICVCLSCTRTTTAPFNGPRATRLADKLSRSMFDTIDADKSGSVDRVEFEDWMATTLDHGRVAQSPLKQFERVVTFAGPGYVIEDPAARADGILVVALDWILANGNHAMAYVRKSEAALECTVDAEKGQAIVEAALGATPDTGPSRAFSRRSGRKRTRALYLDYCLIVFYLPACILG